MKKILLKDIEKVLDEKVRPALSFHGGNIKVMSLEDGILHVRMTGECSRCPSVDLTMESLVNTELKEVFPELIHVMLEKGVSSELISEARNLLKSRH